MFNRSPPAATCMPTTALAIYGVSWLRCYLFAIKVSSLTPIWWCTRVQRTVSRCFAAFRQLRQISRLLPTTMFQSLVTALIYAKLDYGNWVLIGRLTYFVLRLESVLDAAALLIYTLKCSDRVTDALFSLKSVSSTRSLSWRFKSSMGVHHDTLERLTVSLVIMVVKGFVLATPIVCWCCHLIFLLSAAVLFWLLVHWFETICVMKWYLLRCWQSFASDWKRVFFNILVPTSQYNACISILLHVCP